MHNNFYISYMILNSLVQDECFLLIKMEMKTLKCE